MQGTQPSTKKTRRRLMTAAASVALAGAVGFGAVTSGVLPVLAEPVRVEGAETHAPGFADVVEQVSPAVVSVRVQSRIEPASDRGRSSGFSFQFPGLEELPRDHPMRRFFDEFRGDRFQDREFGERERQRAPRSRPSSQGSGFFISADGYIVTNNHVVQGGSEFLVVLDDGTELDAELMGTDPRTDLAVLKVDEDREFTYVAFADDADIRVGDWVVAVGNPFGLGGTVTAGIVSARGRDIGAGPYDDFLQIDAAVNRGNSGGPAFNLNGEVVGINTAIFSPSGGNVGIAFAIPSTTARGVVDSLVESGAVMRGWLGVQIQPVSDDIAESLGLDNAQGALVSEAQADGPARDVGISAGDVILSVDGRDVATPRELARVIGAYAPGTNVDITVWRDGASEEMSIELGQMPGNEQQASLPGQDTAPDDNGDVLLDEFGLTVTPSEDGTGLLVTDVAPGSSAAERGIEAGDVIMTVNNQSVAASNDVSSAVSQARDIGRNAVLMQVARDDVSRFVALPIGQG